MSENTRERWKVVPDFPDYEVSNRGEVRRIDTGALLGTPNKRGYMRVGLSRSGVSRAFFVHVLILDAFGPPRPSADHETNHIDGDKQNNRIENLEWVTQAENRAHAYRLGLRREKGEANTAAKLTRENVIEIRRRAASGERHRRIARDYPVTKNHLDKVIAGTKWTHVPLPRQVEGDDHE